MRLSGTSVRVREHIRTNVVGYIALCCFAFMGTAQALPGTNTVDSGDIKDGKVKGVDVRNESLGSDDVDGLTGGDLAGGSLILHGPNTDTGVFDNEVRVDGDDSSLAQMGKDFLFVRSPTDNPVTVDGRGFLELTEASEPNAPPTNRVRIFARGPGATELVALFSDGDIDPLAIEGD
jgi:hypothetical protein